jgi:cation diffusion facilitator family transporter
MADHEHDHDGPEHHHEHPHDGHDHPHLHEHEHVTDHDHTHPHVHDHHHDQPQNILEWILAALHLGKFAHDHDHSIVGSIAVTSSRGIWAIKISFIGLMITALMQVVIVYFSGSVALLADTIHNFGDASTAIPLWIAFTLSRRPKTRRYTFGFNRAEDLAGVVVVLLILFSAVVAGYQAIDRFINPREIAYLEWVAAAAVIGFLGNEAVAIFRTRVGREIGSAALIADGQHARIDGLTSLAVLFGAVGVWLGFPLADPIIGLVITLAIIRITWNATKSMWYRMMDAVEPEIVDKVENTARSVDGLKKVDDIRCRWVGHQLHAILYTEVDPELTVFEAHKVVEDVRQALFQVLPRLMDVTIHIDPWEQYPKANSNSNIQTDDPHSITIA